METPFDPNTVHAPFYDSKPPSSLPAGYAGLSEGAKKFIREHVPEDDGTDVIVSFETVSEYQPFKTKKARELNPDAEDIYDDVLYIRKNVRGNPLLEIHQPANEQHKRQFPYAWQEFNKGTALSARGTPLSKLGIDAQVVRVCNACNVYTVEDLAMVTDTFLPNIGTGGRELRKRALAYVESSKHAPDLSAMQGQINRMMTLLQAQSQENERLKAENEGLKAKRGPGRPPNASKSIPEPF